MRSPVNFRRRAAEHGRHRGAGHRGRRQVGPSPVKTSSPDRRLHREDHAAGKIPAASSSVKPSPPSWSADLAPDRPPDPSAVPGRLLRNDDPVVVHVVSLNPEAPDIAAMIASSAAAGHLRHPLQRPDRRGRVGYVSGGVHPEPGRQAGRRLKMDLVVAGTRAAVLMVESESRPAVGRSDAGRRGLRPRGFGRPSGHPGTGA